MRLEKAKYRPTILPEHQGNPLIEALPTKHTDEELVDKLGFYPPHSFEETQLAPFERVEYLTRLKNLRQPLPIYLDCFRAVEMAIKEGYSAKNPLSPTTMNFLHYPIDRRPNIEPRTGYLKPKGCLITHDKQSVTTNYTDLTYSYRGARSWPKAKSNSRKATACLSVSVQRRPY